MGVPLNAWRAFLIVPILLSAAGCECSTTPPRTDSGTVFNDGGFTCTSEEAMACLGNVYYSCVRDGEFLSTVMDDCDRRTDGYNLCVTGWGCRVCRPDDVFCARGDVVQCNSDGTGYEIREDCDISAGFVCDVNTCRNLCELAVEDRSYQGCEFFGVDLDNAAIGAGRDASSQQYSIVVSNPGHYPTDVIVERNNAPQGEPPALEEIERVTVLPGDLEVLELPRREVDGSSSFAPCGASSECLAGEACWCAGSVTIEDPPPVGMMHRDCRCRVAAGSNGMNDGTHSALSSRAYRVTSVLPIIAYQFNPLDNVGVFSNDASLLLPTSAIGGYYTVVGWPQTIANSTNANEDFDPTVEDEDLRAFLTIVGASDATHVTITFGPMVRNVIGIGTRENAIAGVIWEFDVGAFDVINIETGGFNADFTGSTVSATHPVSVFVGSEASDAPRFATLANRMCCADHLEEQLFPNDTLGRRFFIGRMPPRSTALNAAFLDPTRDSVGEFNEPEYVRLVAVEAGMTSVTTSLQPPDASFTLAQGESIILIANQDVEINADKAIAVLHVLPSQEAVGIVSDYPGGDPAIIAPAPVEQYRQDYVFLTPSLYAFDFVVITAPAETVVLLDDADIQEWILDGRCKSGPADGIVRRMGDPPPDWLVYRCQFSFPDVVGPRPAPIEDGIQDDGYHTILATDPVGLTVYGFDAYVSYAYAGGLNLQIID